MSHYRRLRNALDVSYTPAADRLMSPLRRFSRISASGGIVLLVCAVVAMVLANSPASGLYHAFFHERISISVGDWTMSHSLHAWVDDVLMAFFFLLVGLEIKREVLFGELRDLRKASMPLLAAVGGMLAPAAIYAAVQAAGTAQGVEAYWRGWGIPTAPDIAFALGVLGLLGRRIPASIRVFLCTLAIADDLGALLVIAIFYTEQLQWPMLINAGLVFALLVVMGRMRIREPWVYLFAGAPLLYYIDQSGVHSTIAGVLLATQVPVTSRVNTAAFLKTSRDALDEFEKDGVNVSPSSRHGEETTVTYYQVSAARALALNAKHVRPPLNRIELKLTPWVTFLIVPLFALGNAGVHLGAGWSELFNPATYGVVLGLVIGKPVGILLASWLAVRLGLAALPSGATWKQMAGVAMLGGIGFTMSMFITNLAFDPASSGAPGARLGILVASSVAAIVGLTWLAMTSPMAHAADELLESEKPDRERHDTGRDAGDGSSDATEARGARGRDT